MYNNDVKSKLKAAAVIGLSMLQFACVPLPVVHDSWRTAQHRGEVRDSVTWQPIYAAKIVLESAGASQHAASTFSKRDGSFEIGPVVEREAFYVVQLKSAEGDCADSLTVSHPDYEPVKINWRVSSSGTGSFCRNEIGNHAIQLVKRR